MTQITTQPSIRLPRNQQIALWYLQNHSNQERIISEAFMRLQQSKNRGKIVTADKWVKVTKAYLQAGFLNLAASAYEYAGIIEIPRSEKIACGHNALKHGRLIDAIDAYTQAKCSLPRKRIMNGVPALVALGKLDLVSLLEVHKALGSKPSTEAIRFFHDLSIARHDIWTYKMTIDYLMLETDHIFLKECQMNYEENYDIEALQLIFRLQKKRVTKPYLIGLAKKALLQGKLADAENILQYVEFKE